MRNPERHLRRAEASEYLRDVHNIQHSPKTLAKLAVTGGGPRFQKAGKFPLYPPVELDEYARKLLSPLVSSTAELAAAKAAEREIPRGEGA